MKNLLLACGFMLTTAFVSSCGFNDRMRHLDAGRFHSDSIISLLANDSVYALFPEDHFQKRNLENILNAIRYHCNWETRRGQFTDYYSAENEGRHDIAYIYEYFLDCDSLRMVFTYHADEDAPELYGFTVEPLEMPTTLLQDPMKSILKNKDWDKPKH